MVSAGFVTDAVVKAAVSVIVLGCYVVQTIWFWRFVPDWWVCFKLSIGIPVPPSQIVNARGVVIIPRKTVLPPIRSVFHRIGLFQTALLFIFSLDPTSAIGVLSMGVTRTIQNTVGSLFAIQFGLWSGYSLTSLWKQLKFSDRSDHNKYKERAEGGPTSLLLVIAVISLLPPIWACIATGMCLCVCVCVYALG